MLGLLGSNGAGKTTTLRMLYGFVRPDAGTIRYDGRDFETERTALKRLIGVCTQDDTLDYDFTVRQNLRVYAGYYRPYPEGVDARVEGLLEQFGLARYATASPRALSGGYLRRLLIARSIVHRPRILFLDEPTTGLDPAARVEVWELIAQLRAEGLGVILTTHYMDEAERLSDALLVMKEGRAVARGKPAEVLDALVGAHVLVLLEGDPEHAPILAALAARGTRTARVLGERRVPIDAPTLAALSEEFASTRLIVRPPNLDDLFLALSVEKAS